MDPRVSDLRNAKNDLSPLMKARSKSSGGEVVNFCPFECDDHDLDEQGYCRHMVGITEDKKTYEPVEVRPNGYRFINGLKPEKILKTDQLVRITTCYRVYRKEDKNGG